MSKMFTAATLFDGNPCHNADMKRRILTIRILFLSILCSCGSPGKSTNDKPAVDLGTPVQGDWAIVRYEGEPDSLNPLTSHSAYGNSAMYGSNSSQIYEFLLAYNTKDWTFTKPMLAEAPPSVSKL